MGCRLTKSEHRYLRLILTKSDEESSPKVRFKEELRQIKTCPADQERVEAGSRDYKFEKEEGKDKSRFLISLARATAREDCVSMQGSGFLRANACRQGRRGGGRASASA